METNNYTTNLQLVSQEYPDEKTSLQTKTKKLLEYFRLSRGLLPICHLLDPFFLCLSSNRCLDKYD